MALQLRRGEPLDALRGAAVERLEGAGFEKVEYLELRGAEDLELLERAVGPARLFAAAWLDGVRLIDNIEV